MSVNSPYANSIYPMKPIGFACDFISGFAFKSDDFTNLGLPVIKIKNIQSGKVTTDASECVPVGLITDKLKKFCLSNGDVLIAMTGQGSVGRVGRLYIKDKETPVLNQRVGKFVPDEVKLNLDYLYYIISARSYEDYLFAAGSGSGQPNLSPATILSVEIPYPPYDVQCETAAVLKALDDKIEINNQISQTLEHMAQAIFKSWFVDFEPVKAKMKAKPEGRDPERAAMCVISGKVDAEIDQLTVEQLEQLAATAALFPDELVDSEWGVIPKGWTFLSLDSIADFLNGLALQKFPPESNSEWLPVIKIAQLKKGDTTGSDRASAQLNADYVVDDGDVLFSWSGSLEVDIWCGGKGALNQHLFKVTSKLYPQWFYYQWTKEHLVSFKTIAAGKAVTMGHIQRIHLTEALCATPSNDILDRLDSVFTPLLNQFINNRIQAKTIAKLRDSLLLKLLAG